jgi:hypothetical protein
VQSPPGDLTDDAVALAVSEGWGVRAVTATYLPVGYGSHHWSVDDAAGGRWFASVDVVPTGEPGALVPALGVAVAARDCGLSFVVAPRRTRDGTLVRRLPGGYAIALYPFVHGRSGGFGDGLSPVEAAELVGMLRSLHELSPSVCDSTWGPVGVETFEVEGRGRLQSALGEAGEGVWSGPYGERLRRLVARHAEDVARAWRRYDGLVAGARSRTEDLVLTHGEPHPGNLIRTPQGPVLVDWETALLAPPERDLWLLHTRTDGRASGEYTTLTGRPLRAELLTAYQLAWWLADVAVFVELLRHAAEETADTSWSWEALEATLEALASSPPR